MHGGVSGALQHWEVTQRSKTRFKRKNIQKRRPEEHDVINAKRWSVTRKEQSCLFSPGSGQIREQGPLGSPGFCLGEVVGTEWEYLWHEEAGNFKHLWWNEGSFFQQKNCTHVHVAPSTGEEGYLIDKLLHSHELLKVLGAQLKNLGLQQKHTAKINFFQWTYQFLNWNQESWIHRLFWVFIVSCFTHKVFSFFFLH